MSKIKKIFVCSVLVLLTLSAVVGGKMVLSVEQSDENQYSDTNLADNKDSLEVEEVIKAEEVLKSQATVLSSGEVSNKQSIEVVAEKREPRTSSIVYENPELQTETTNEYIQETANEDEDDVNNEIDRTPQISAAVFYNPDITEWYMYHL